MRKILYTFALVTLLIPGFAGAQDLQEAQDFEGGWAAYQDGDYATAYREWRPLAEAGHANAQYNLGLMHANGQGVPQDYTKAAHWYRLAAEQGNTKAQANLGLMHANG